MESVNLLSRSVGQLFSQSVGQLTGWLIARYIQFSCFVCLYTQPFNT